MSNKGIIAIVISSLIVVAGLLYLYFAIPKYSRWDENLQTNLKEPYSLEFAEKLLVSTYKEDFKRIRPADNLIKELEEFNYNNKATYVFLGDNYSLTAKECKTLMDFVKNGNTAFISSRNWPDGLNFDSLTENVFAQLFEPIKPERMARYLPEGLNVELDGFTKKYHSRKGIDEASIEVTESRRSLSELILLFLTQNFSLDVSNDKREAIFLLWSLSREIRKPQA